MTKRILLFAFIFIAALSACGSNADSDPTQPVELRLMAHDSFAISEATIAAFETANNAKVTLIPSGDAGAALNQAILSKEDPLADILYGVDNSFMGRALDAGIFIPYASPNLKDVPDSLKLDAGNHLTPINFGDVCLNYDIDKLAELDIEPPDNLQALTDPAYKGLLVVQNPATSSPGLSFLLATIGEFGEQDDYDYLDFWADLADNGVMVTSGWEEAYWGQFSAASDGQRPLVVSYASSPPAEVVFNELDAPPSAAIVADGTCFRQIEFAGILAGTPHVATAQAFIDFMLTDTFQADIPLNMFVFPANESVTLPDVFQQWAAIPDDPVFVSPQAIDQNREQWIEDWTALMLR